MQMATEAWFRGRWRVARIVADAAGCPLACFAGRADFVPEAGRGLICREAGLLRHGGVRHPAERVTLWRFPGDGRIEVLFADGRPFHAFGPELAEAVHLCGADRYVVTYDFAPTVWHSRWQVRGPLKHYVMTTRYRRGIESGDRTDYVSR